MFKLLLAMFLFIFLASCGGNAVIKKEKTCKRDSSIICSKDNAPILEKMDSKSISANVKMFGASYKDNNMVKYMKTDVSEVDQCISVYQYYNCKAYCESDSITKAEKIKKDQEIVENCTATMNKNKLEQKEAAEEISKKFIGKRIFIDFILEDGVELDKKLKKIIYLAFEEKATEKVGKYVIIDDEIKKKVMDRIIHEKGWKQNDPRFLPELEKQLDANIMVQIVITKLGSKLILTNKYILIEEGITLRIKNLKYDPNISNIAADKFEDFDSPKVTAELKEERIYDSFLKLAGEFLDSMDN